jgi:NADP-dependent aldehyde dehydrogenase
MGSVNPVFVTARALARRGPEILRGFVDSFTLGAGQFCTKPGLLCVPADQGVEQQLTQAVQERPAAALLNEHIAAGYREGLARLVGDEGVTVLVRGGGVGRVWGAPTLLATTVNELLARPEILAVECFGPTSLLVTYTDEQELRDVAEALEGQLTATVHAEDDDAIAPALLEALAERVGRVVWNGWPTGVSVSWAMQHGGPYPATTAPATTSVGTEAISRFLRPVTYQSVPDALLPAALRDANPWGLPRRVDGRVVPAA